MVSLLLREYVVTSERHLPGGASAGVEVYTATQGASYTELSQLGGVDLKQDLCSARRRTACAKHSLCMRQVKGTPQPRSVSVTELLAELCCILSCAISAHLPGHVGITRLQTKHERVLFDLEALQVTMTSVDKGGRPNVISAV